MTTSGEAVEQKRQRVLAAFGEFALQSEDLDAVLTEACRLVSEALGTERAKVMEIEAGDEVLFVRAGVGWASDIVGKLRLAMSQNSSETFSIRERVPVISQDIRTETRFEFADFLKDGGVVALANVPIILPEGRAYGLLQVDAIEPREFGPEDTEFLRTYATLLGGVIDRLLKTEFLRASEARFRAMFENAGVGVACVLLEGDGWLEVNDALCTMLGYSRSDLLVTKPSDIVHPNDRGLGGPSSVFKAATGTDRSVVEGRFLHRSGAAVWVRQTTSLVRDATGQPDFRIAIIEDISDQKVAEAKLTTAVANAHTLALTDALTGLPNREAFRQWLEDAVAEGVPATLVLIDADQLKRANDTDGHAAGDALLCRLSDRLRAVAYPGTLVARLGGDEFALLIKEHIEGDRLNVVLGELCRPIHLEGLTMPHTASAGIAYHSASGCTAARLMQKADRALYAAKAKGRGTWQIFDDDLSAREQSKIAAMALIRRAVGEKWVVPFYQPKVELTTGHIVGFEALLRIKSSDGTLHTAGIVNHGLSEPDLEYEADRLILERVLLDLHHWRSLRMALPVAINLANSTIRRQGFAKRVLDLMALCGVEASLLEVEIVETVLLDGRDETTSENLALLSDAGIRIALDDFGTGYASLSHLRTYRVDQIKIDQQFVKASLTSPDDRAIISAIVGLGKSLSLQVIAEGIEIEQQLRILIDAGCEIGQGFLFSAAVPADAVADLLASTPGLPS